MQTVIHWQIKQFVDLNYFIAQKSLQNHTETLYTALFTSIHIISSWALRQSQYSMQTMIHISLS